MIVVGVLFYVFLWALYANGDSVLLAPLLIPAILAIMVALGVALQRFIGHRTAQAALRRRRRTRPKQ